MLRFLTDIDRLLRGGFTRPEELRAGQVPIPARTLVLGAVVLGCFYGLFMGTYGSTRSVNGTGMQLLATTLKVPLLFLLTLIVTFPSLYVLSALAGSPLRFRATLRLLLGAIATNLALLASLGPVAGFFTLSTESYPFMIVMNVVFFGASGLVGLFFLRRALTHLFDDQPAEAILTATPAQPTESRTGPDGDEPTPAPSPPTPPTPRPTRPSRQPRRVDAMVFRGWLVVYGVVGAQMGWILRPFIGNPDMPFEWFRERESHFLEGFLNALGRLFS